jgi:hypothetical protein
LSADLSPACSLLKAAWPHVRTRIQFNSVRDVRPYCVGRVLAEQQAEYAKGRTAPGRKVTNADGIIVLSKHQKQIRHGELAVHALDALMYFSGVADWSLEAYRYLMVAAEAEGLISGLDWNDNGVVDADEHVNRGPRDGPHVECHGLIIVMKSVQSAPESSVPERTEGT